jgi:sulfatase modifying factor 1
VLRLCVFLLLPLLIAFPASAVSIEWVTIGNPGNPGDTEVMNDGTSGHGSVSYVYRISKYEVTNAQYVEFLNAVADADPNALYHTSMGSGFGGITRSGSSGSYTYSAIAGRGNMPVNYVSFVDAARFANWIFNGQPTGPQGPDTTDWGVYATSGPMSVSDRFLDATLFVPSDNEWYKAAYYSPSGVYFDFPAGSNTQPACAAPSGAPNSANCDAGVRFPSDDATDADVDNLTSVGSFTGSPSPFGTFDQGGNVWEWTDTRPRLDSSPHTFRGGSFDELGVNLRASTRPSGSFFAETQNIGFRLATTIIPEPGTGLLVIGGLLGLAGSRKGRQ